MRSKRSNSTKGRGTPSSRRHSKTMSPEQKRDKARLKERNGKVKGTKFVRVRVSVPVDDPDDLTPDEKDLTSFPSEFSALRRDEHDNLGYRIPRLLPGPNGEAVPMPEMRGRKKGVKILGVKKKKGEGNEKMPAAYSVLVAGQPDIDAGVAGWIQPKDTQDFVRRGDRMDSLLETFNRVSDQVVYKKDEAGNLALDAQGKKVVLKRIPHVKTMRAESSFLQVQVDADTGKKETVVVKTSADTLSNRDTVGVSPYLSRALQRMVEDGYVQEARQALESTMEPLGRFYEGVYRGPETHAKVTSMLPHLDSGHAHYDIWRHETYLSTAATGVGGEIVPVRRWDAKAGCHYGPGPGVMFWGRHFDVLDDLQELAKTEPEAAKRAGYTNMVCEQAISTCRRRAADSYAEATAEKLAVEATGGTYTKWIKPADDYARDIRVSREADRLLAQAIRDLGLEKDYVAIGKAEYKAFLIEAYKAGETGIKMETPEDLEQVARVAERAEKRARADREATEKALQALSAEKEALARLRAEAASARSGLDADAAATKAALTAAEKAQRDNETALARAEAAARQQVEPILAAARQEAAGIVEKAELSGFRLVLSKILPGRPFKARTVAEAEQYLDTGVKGIRQEAELGAWARILKFCGKGEVQPGATVETLQIETETAITGRIAAGVAAGLAGFFAVFKREVPAVQTPEEFVEAVVKVAESEKATARRDGLALAVAKMREVEVSELADVDEAGLTKAIETEAAKFGESDAARDQAVVRLFAGRTFGGALATSLTERAKQSAFDMKDALTRELKRLGNAEVTLERALHLLDKYDPNLAKDAHRILDARPKLPEVAPDAPVEAPGVVAKKTAKKVGKAVNEKSAGGDGPGR